MANYATLKAAIQQVIKTNGNNEITGALLQQSLLSMIASLGAGYQFIDVATPQTTPGTPDQNVFYIGGPGTYSNMGGTVVNDGEIGIFCFNGSWSNKKLAVGKDYSKEIAELARVKLDKVVGTNLVNPNTLLPHSYINASSGNISTSGGSGYSVSDYIPVIKDGVGQNIIANASPASYAAAYAVYDENYNVLRAVSGTTQYTYQQGDYYVRIGFNNNDADKMANYGTVLAAYVPYVDYAPLSELDKRVDNLESTVGDSVEQISQKLDKVLGVNLIDPDKLTQGAYINSSGGTSPGSSGYCVTDYILVKGNNIIATAYGSGPIVFPFAVYDSNKNFIRTGTTNQYMYQSGDSYVRFTISYTPGESRANYGTVLAAYEPFTDYKPLNDLQKNVAELDDKVDEISSLADAIPNKLDKVIGVNLIDPNAMLIGAALSMNSTTGVPSTGYPEWYKVSDYIPVNGQNIIANAYSSAGTWASMFIYDANKNFLRNNGTSNQYTYQDGDAYVRISLGGSGAELRANYGTVLAAYEPYTDYKPLADLTKRVDALDGGEKTDLVLTQLNKLYLVYNSVLTSRNYATKLWLSHFLNNSEYKNKEIFFENGQRYFPIYPTSVSSKSETDSGVNITPKASYNNAQLSYKLRLTNNATSKAVKPRILVIGDSVTNGYGAGQNKTVSWLPNQYWAYAKMLFEMDKIDGGDNANEYNALFLGGVGTDGNFTINYRNVSRAIRAKAEAKGGAALNELFGPTWGGSGDDTPNPFYDSVNQTFSIADYLRKYRTMDNLGVRLVSASTNPAGESVVGSDGVTYTIGTNITSQTLLSNIDVCTPTHIIVNMVHNTSLANYQTYAPQVLSVIQSELPGVPIVLAVIDETGTYFPVDFPDYVESQINVGTLHSKNLSIYNWIKENIENESNGIYLLGLNFVQPTARSLATVNYVSADSVEKSEKEIGLNVVDPVVGGANYHPNNYAHAAWGYTLYSMIKWLIS